MKQLTNELLGIVTIPFIVLWLCVRILWSKYTFDEITAGADELDAKWSLTQIDLDGYDPVKDRYKWLTE